MHNILNLIWLLFCSDVIKVKTKKDIDTIAKQQICLYSFREMLSSLETERGKMDGVLQDSKM